MEDLIGIIILLVLYVVATSVGKKKKAAEKTAQKPVQPEQVQKQVQKKQPETVQKNKQQKPKRKPEESKTVLQQKQSAGENQPIATIFSEMQVQNQAFETPENRDEERQAFAKDIMRGVIMNEILTRPNEREAIRRMRQRR